jgi:Holliday junction resolvase
MNTKAKGTKHERDLIHKLWAAGFASIRSAGSGSQRYPAPDILTGNNLRKLGIECKSSKNTTIYIPKQEITDLKTFCTTFGAEPWIAVKCKTEEWFFLNPEDILQTKKNYAITIKRAKSFGLLLEELLEQ